MEEKLKDDVLRERYQNNRGARWFIERHGYELDPSNNWEDIMDEDDTTGDHDDLENSPKAASDNRALKEMAIPNSLHRDHLIATTSKLQPIFLSLLKKYIPSYTHQNVFRGLHNGQPVVKKRGVKPVLFVRYRYQDRLNEAIKNHTHQAYNESRNKNGAKIFRFWRAFWFIVAREALKKEEKTRIKVPNLPPHKYYSSQQISMFKAFVAADSRNWYDLPGPMDWWPDSYDFGKWDIEDSKIAGYRLACEYFNEYSSVQTPNDFHT
ncbi:hypothetical protein EIK77_002526 [Talaromyces pinophilus]|nr:hypothetical protein EIK77_002526 [Talaromyces pinophilus]